MLGFLRLLVPNFIRRSYALKFGIALLILGLSVGAIGFVATSVVADGVEDNTIQEFEGVADQEATGIENWDEQNRLLVNTKARSSAAQQGNVEQIDQDLSGLELPNTGVDMHYVNHQTGEIVESTNEFPSELVDIEYPEDERDLLSSSSDRASVTNPYVTGEERGDLNPTIVVSYVRTIDDTHAMIYEVSLNDYGRQFQSHQEGSELGVAGDRQTIVTDAEGQYLMDDVLTSPRELSAANLFGESYDEEDVVFSDAQARIDNNQNLEEGGQRQAQARVVDGDPPSLLQIEGQDGAQRYDFDVSGFVVGYQQVEGLDWIVFVHTPRDQAMGFVDQVSFWGQIATVGGVLLIFLFGIVLGRSTSSSIDRLTSKAEEMEEGNLEVDFETKRIDNIGRLYQGFAEMRDALREQIQEAEQAREDAEAERERVQRINDELEDAAQEYCAVMGAAADGDLTVRADVDTDNEQMAAIGEDFNEMLDDIEATIEQLKQFAREVATSSEEVTASSEEVKSASEQVSESVQEISDGAERQNKSLQSVNQEMDGLSTTIEEIAASSNEVADIAARTAETGREGREAAENAIAGMNEVGDEASMAVEEIERLEEEVGQIDELIDFIAEIAEQTNMLALNANIEAARSTSGEEGEGFGVVAEEVKELSEDAKEAAEEIENRLEGIRRQTERSAEEVQRTSDKITEHTETVERTATALDEIAEYAEETNTGVQEISAATEEQAASTEEVVAMVDEATTISEETTSEAENVAAAAEEQTTAMTEVSQSASNLAGQAARLSEALDRFDTDVDVTVASGGPPEELIDETEGTLPAGDGQDMDTELGTSGLGSSGLPSGSDDDEFGTAGDTDPGTTDGDDVDTTDAAEFGGTDADDVGTTEGSLPGDANDTAAGEELAGTPTDEPEPAGEAAPAQEGEEVDWADGNVDLSDVDTEATDADEPPTDDPDDTIDEFDEEEDPFTFGDPDEESTKD